MTGRNRVRAQGRGQKAWAQRALCSVALVPVVFLLWLCPLSAAPDPKLPLLEQPVNDFAHVVDASSDAEMSRMIRALQAKTGDVVVVATVPTIEPYGDVREYANKLFENGGRGIGQKGKDNGLLILVAIKEHKVWIEVGYGLEEYITDGYAGETTREFMTPQFRAGRFGAGLLAGTERVVGRIAQARGVSLDGVRVPQQPVRRTNGDAPIPFWIILLVFIVILIVSRIGGGPGSRRRFWGGPFIGGWSSGVGPFGGGFGGGGFGGGGGGGFGGFGGGGGFSGGGGGSSW